MLIDSHCHLDRLNLSKHDNDLGNALQAAREKGVGHFLCISISVENRARVLEIAETYADVYATVGVHPLDVSSGLVTQEQLIQWAQAEKIVGIGETGLDYHYSEDTKATQQQSFAVHLQAAAKSGLPVVVHTRNAKEDTLSAIKDYGSLESAGVLHCFTEDWDMARRAMDLNYCISISGIVTFRNADALRDVARQVPLDRLLVETDSPYLAPIPFRGKPNEPQYVRQVAEYVAEVKGVSYETLITATADNYFRLFNKAKPKVVKP